MSDNFWQKLKKPIIGLSPMDGVIDDPARQIQCQIAKPDVIYTEFISVEGFTKKSINFSRKLAYQENERPIIAQVFGCTPECFYITAGELIKMGFDGVDINMGCPAKSVLQRGGGAALIGNYQLAENIIKKCLRATEESGKKMPLSIKTRIASDKINSKDWFSFLGQFPLAEVTVHGRKLKQENSGLVNWDGIKMAAEILRPKRITCLGNGGIKSLPEAREKCQKYNLDGVLIGQSALGNPWIFKKGYRATKEEILSTILKHGELAWNFYEARSEIHRSPSTSLRAKADGGKGYLTVLKHFGWYPKAFKNCKELRRILLQTRNLKQLKKSIDQFGQI